MSADIELYETIKNSGIDLILSLPCILLKSLLEIIDEKNEIQHIPVTREEEGVGIAAGAYLGGRKPAILMQNSGLGNSVNAIKSLLQLYKIPVIFIMSHRGAEGGRRRRSEIRRHPELARHGACQAGRQGRSESRVREGDLAQRKGRVCEDSVEGTGVA